MDYSKKNSVVYDKAFNFSRRVVSLYKELCEDKKEYTLAKQLLRCGTSIGANIREGLEGQSKKDFIAKLSISLKEAAETEYWLELLVSTNVLTENRVEKMLLDVKELIRILNSILKTARDNLEG